MVYFTLHVMKRRIKTCLRGIKSYRWLRYITFILVLTLAIIYLELRILSRYRTNIITDSVTNIDSIDHELDKQLYIYISGRYKPFVPKRRLEVEKVSYNKGIQSRTIVPLKKKVTNFNLLRTKPFIEKKITKFSLQKTTRCKFLQHPFFPFCTSKVQYLTFFWGKDPCFHDVHGVNGSECSIYEYLTKIEPYCMGKENLYRRKHLEVAKMNLDFNGLLKLFDYDYYRWMKNRITTLWPSWLSAGKLYANLRSERKANRLKVVVFAGSLEVNHFLFDMAGKGGPLGELIQWSDVTAALYVLGYDVTFVTKVPDLLKVLKENKTRCASGVNKVEVDVIYTDINGVTMMMNGIGSSSLAKYRCMLRVLDSFGTYPEFNFVGYPHEIPGGRAGWSNLNIIPTQFMTLYPHTHDNYFLGFVIPNKISNFPSSENNNKKDRALLYAKRASYIRGKERYLQVVSEYFEIHATCLSDYLLPSFIKNHGPVSSERVQELLLESKVFIGVGFPYEGPGPLEAMTNGAVFLQPKFDVPINKLNSDFFRSKPTLRKLTSQNPYMEEFVGEPYCYTINVSDETLLRTTLQKIKSMERLQGKIPKEFTNEGLIERVHAFTEYMDYCNPYSPPWPPLDHLQTYISLPGQSCKEFCMSINLVCERTYFNEINKAPLIERYSKLNCNEVKIMTILHAPSVNSSTNICYIQNQQQTFSCMHGEPKMIRLCPCRNYEKEQSAICKDCL